MGTQKGKLFELAEMFHTYQKSKKKDERYRKTKKHTTLKGKHFDEGKSITLSYNLEMYPEVLYESHQRQTTASEMSIWGDNRSDAFYVEPFDADDPGSLAFSYEAMPNEALLDKIVRNNDDASPTVTVPVSEVVSADELEKKLNKVVDPKQEMTPPAQSPVMGGSEKKSLTPVDTGEKIDTGNNTSALPATGETGSQPYNVSDDEFARDIGAILQGQKIYNKDQKKTVAKPEAVQPATPRDTKGDPLAAEKNEHQIFEKIAQSMQYANSYDLGAIALEKRFEQMEQELEEEQVNRLLQNKSTSQERKPREGDAIDELTPPAKKKPPTQGENLLTERYGSKIVLDETNGGRIVTLDDLQKGDLILAASSDGTFDFLQGSLGSESVGGLYLGQQQILTKGAGDLLEERKVDVTGKGVLVVLRHQDMSSEKASNITNSLVKLRSGAEKVQPDKWSKIACASINIHPDVCNSQNMADKNKCTTWSGKIRLGTINNDAFMCAESIIESFKNNQIPFVSSTKEHNGTLKYFGHLKNKT